MSGALAQHGQWMSVIEGFARKRSEVLLADHRRVREASRSKGRYEVTPLLPVDVIGVFVLLPALDL